MSPVPVSHRVAKLAEDAAVRPSKSFPALDFAKRLETAVHGHPHAPHGHGQQKWLRDLVEERTALKVSAEAVRKWFSGEARPRPDVMRKIAQSLEVDEAWLSLGLTPAETPVEAKRRNATAEGAVNLVAGLIQMYGGHIAFADNQDQGADIYAIINGKKLEIEVKTARDMGERELRFALAQNSTADAVIGVVPNPKTLGAKLLWLTPEIIKQHGRRKGGYVEIVVEHEGANFAAAGTPVPQVNSFKSLIG